MGITPAYAGKSDPLLPAAALGGDHPRVCGEKFLPPGGVRDVLGSPPRMRGKEYKSELLDTCTGITPAYAGKRGSRESRGGWQEDHPRVCGEKTWPASATTRRSGSPPRMRGKDIQTVVLQGQSGITPAYAGKSSRPRAWCRCAEDHPRVCGEKTKKIP